ncbi:hypothetical protein RRG08_025919 [Elysia crispata]|uniref:Uncharacterized protein n=1 Tax=Elysia crispata TaxID=231223 RepID=A0AAE1DYE5_9GAST|nr:hypothetical protein RRG08_025919 [Elysia crispata]
MDLTGVWFAGTDLMVKISCRAPATVLTRFQEACLGLFVLKCYCHSLNLVAEHANKVLSNQAEQVIQDVNNYFKMSPNRQKSLVEFQEFASTEPNKILKPCQTRWLSQHQCCPRVLKQRPALLLFFTR